MITFRCDRCGSEIKREEAVAVKIVHHGFMQGVKSSGRNFELCPSCTKSVFVVITGNGNGTTDV